MNQYLVISDNKDLWPNGGRLLLLGKWCQKRNKELLREGFNFDIANPSNTFGKEIEVVDYANTLFDVLLKELTVELNKFHKVKYSERYWNIIIGPWLTRHIRDVVNRYITLNNAIVNYKFDKVIVPFYIDKDLSCFTYSEHAERRLNDSLWSDMIYADMLNNWPKLDKTLINKRIIRADVIKIKTDNHGALNTKVKKIVLSCFNLFSYFKRETDAVITNTYLPIFQEVMLQLSMWQTPQLWVSPKVKGVDYNSKSRKCFFQGYENYQACDREVRRLIHKLIPTCYLEGYKSLLDQINNLNWPSNPKFIYTSNRFGTDEVFKLWVAEKVNIGTPYYVGQHGNGYGTAKSEQKLTEINSCDKFFSWGWNEECYTGANIVPAFMFKQHCKLCNNFNKNGRMLIVGAPSESLLRWNDYFFKIFYYHKYALTFFNALSERIKIKTVVRLYNMNNQIDKQVWESNQSESIIKFSQPNTDIYKLIQESRVVVYTYDSTGILENLSLNVPMICFWEGGLDGLVHSAIPYYKLLISVGILHDSPESAVHHIEENWSRFDKWWDSKKVLNARIKFCNKYARKTDSPVSTLRELLLQG